MSAPSSFTIPLWIDLLAVFCGAFTGVLVAAKHRYDIVGASVLALLTGLGGALLRDGLFIKTGGQVLLQTEWYVLVCVGAVIFTPLLLKLQNRLARAVDWMDTISIGLYGMIGTQKALAAGLAYTPAIMVGVVNAVGGGILRDIVTNDSTVIFRPGSFYAAAVIIGSSVCVFGIAQLGWAPADAGLIGCLITIGVRTAAVIFDIRTKPLA